MRLTYDLVGKGWAECKIELEGREAVISASYLSDALDDLCTAVLAILSGSGTSRASFVEEPGEYRWTFQRVEPDHVRVLIEEFADMPHGGARKPFRTVIEGSARLRSLAGALLSELQRLLAKHGEVGYKAEWAMHNFPTRRISELQRLLV